MLYDDPRFHFWTNKSPKCVFFRVFGLFGLSKRKEDKMDTKGYTSWKNSIGLSLATSLLSAAMVVTLVAPASSDDKQEATQLVERAQMTLQSFMSDSSMEPFRDLAKQAKGVLVVPQLLKGAFVFGASGGSGVLLSGQKG
jgi:hypothetical protein